MNKILMTGLYFVASKLLQRGARSSEEITKLKLASGYVQAVKIARLLLMTLVAAGACLIFLLIGLILVHHTILVYSNWDASLKVTVTLICAGVYILTAIGIFASVFAEDKWMKMFNTEDVVKELNSKT